MKCILGTKVGMTQVFRDDGTVVPVTRVQAGPCVITQVRKNEQGKTAIQLGFGEQKTYRLNKSEQGHLKGIAVGDGMTVRFLRECATSQEGLSRGDVIRAGVFSAGDVVHVTGTSKGRGFQGVVKRHGFGGGPASHGHKDNLRMPGSIGAGGVQRVFKDMRMAGHMGDAQVTVQNLEIVDVRAAENEILIKGALPGARGSLLFISSEKGDLQVERAVEEAAATQEEAPAAPETASTAVEGEAVSAQ